MSTPSQASFPPAAALADDRDQLPWHEALAKATRAVVGAGTVTLGAQGLLLGLPGGSADLPLFVLSAVVTLGGVVLLLAHRLPVRFGRPERLAGAVAALGGLTLNVFVSAPFPGSVQWGAPVPWISTPGDEASLTAALPWQATAHLDRFSALADVAFWAYVGLFVAILVGLVRRAATRPGQRSDR